VRQTSTGLILPLEAPAMPLATNEPTARATNNWPRQTRLSPRGMPRGGAEVVGVVLVGIVVGLDAGTQTAWGWLLPALFIYGLGVGLATAQLTGVILQDVPVQLSGQSRCAAGIPWSSSDVESRPAVPEKRTVPRIAMPRADPTCRAVDSSGSAIAGLAADPSTAAVADAAKQAFSDATRLAAFTGYGPLWSRFASGEA
jgi:hypothetical protein